MKASAFALIVVLFLPSATAAADWWTLNDKHTYQGADGKTVRVWVLSVDLSKGRLRIVSVPFESGRSVGSSDLSVRELGQTLAGKPEYQRREWVLVSGGFSSYDVDVPLGLLVVDGRVYSTISRERSRVQTAGSEWSQFRWSGILCQAEGRGWDIIPVGRYAARMCHQALQAGPVIVEPPSKVGVAGSEIREHAYTRTAVCLTGGLIMKVVVTRDETNLLPLATWMAKPESAGGLGCRVAMNLSGDDSSGAFIHTPKQKPTMLGAGSFPLPTALLFEPQK